MKSIAIKAAASVLAAVCLAGCGGSSTKTVSNNGHNTVVHETQSSTVTKLDSKVSESSAASSRKSTVVHAGEKPASSEVSSEEESSIVIPSNVTKLTVSEEEKRDTEAEAKIEKKEIRKEVKIGDTIKTDFAEMTIDSYHIGKQINPVNPKKPYYFFWDCKEGSTYFYFTGTYKNISSRSDTVSFLDAYITINGKYKYLASDIFQGDDSFELTGYVKPLESTRYFVYADIPDELMSSFSTADIEFDICGYVGDDTKFERYKMSIKK